MNLRAGGAKRAFEVRLVEKISEGNEALRMKFVQTGVLGSADHDFWDDEASRWNDHMSQRSWIAVEATYLQLQRHSAHNSERCSAHS